MKVIIDGKSYDTDTAKLIGEDRFNDPLSDFQCWKEGLYYTKKGQYFLAGSGIGLLTAEKARRWVEEHMNPHQVEAAYTIEEG